MIILNTSTIKEWDIFTIKNKPITSLDLMEKAGNACTNKIIKEMEEKESFHDTEGIYKGAVTSTQQWIEPLSDFAKHIQNKLDTIEYLKNNN